MPLQDTERKLLIISYPFPPIPYSGSYRILRMCKGLVKLGVDVHVLTINIDARIPNDFDLLNKVPRGVTIHRTRIFDPWLTYQRWMKDKKNLRNLPLRALSLAMKLITIPDHQIFWIPSVYQRARNVIRNNGIRNVLVTSPPVSTLLTGLLLKKALGIRFLADLRDPIVGNVAQVNLLDPRDFFSRFERKLLQVIESRIVKGADVVIANTETHRDELRHKYNTNSICCVRNCFDEDDYKGITRKKYDKFTIAHVGSMYGLRKPDILFKAIKKLEEQYSPWELNLRVLFVGSTDSNLAKLVSRYGVEKYVRFVGMVSHRKAIEIMVRSHLLLLIKAAGKDGLGQIPAKFFEYLGANNEIIYFGPSSSEVAKLIRSSCCGWTIERDTHLAFEVVKDNYSRYQNALQEGSNQGKRFSQFDTHHMAKKMLAII